MMTHLRCRSARVTAAALATLLIFGANIQSVFADGLDNRPRLLVLTDIGGDPDDTQSMIRLMLYSNEFDIEALIASASGTPNELKRKITQPDLIRNVIRAYGEVRPNLIKHAEGYPSAEELLDRVDAGNANRGREAIGAEHDTWGSKRIIAAVDAHDDRPLNIAIWGGQTDLAQALWRVREDRGEEGLKAFISKIRVYDIADQDGIQPWMFEQFPDVFYVLNKAPEGRDRRDAAFRGMYLGGNDKLTSREWIETHVQIGHGPLGKLYPMKTWTAPNPHGVMKEGDTPSWLYFLPTGLSDPLHPGWGGWGGRFKHESGGLFRDAADTVDKVTDARATVSRWREHFQNDFAARMDWCIADDYSEANHNPTAVLNDDKTRDVLEIAIEPGEHVQLSAAGSGDPDDQPIEYRWWIYREASAAANPETRRMLKSIQLSDAKGVSTSFTVPEVTEPLDIHVILEVSDAGAPMLWTYRRAIIQIDPKRN